MRFAMLAVLARGGCSGEESNGMLPAGPQTNAHAVALPSLPAALTAVVLQEGAGFRLAEVQRDLARAQVPANARDAANAKPDAFVPERVIESSQADGTVIYELFASAKKDEPAMEVEVRGGKAAVRAMRSPD